MSNPFDTPRWGNDAPPPDAAIDQTTGECLRNSDGNFITRTQLLAAWEQAKRQLAIYKDAEAQLRAQVVAVFTDPGSERGTAYEPLANGWRLKVVKGVDYKFISRSPSETVFDVAERIQQTISALEIEGRDAAFMEAVADQLVKWKPELSVSTYGKMPEDVRAVVHPIINEYLETRPAAPQVEIVPPGEKEQ